MSARRRLILAYIGDRTGTNYPLGLFLLRDHLRNDPEIAALLDVEVRIFRHDVRPTAAARQLALLGPDRVGLSLYVWNTEKSLALGRALAAHAALPIDLGGPNGWPQADGLLGSEPWIHTIVRGEGERPYRQLIRVWLGLDALPLKDVAGLAMPGPLGPIHTDAPRTVNDLSELPELFRAGNEELAEEGRPVLYETSRGCPFVCRFCYWSGEALGAKMRYLPMERIEREIDFILARGPRELFFIDSELNNSLPHAKRVLEAVIRTRSRHPAAARTVIGMHLGVGVRKIDTELAQLSFAAGVRVIIGIQSLDQATLRRTNRQWCKLPRFFDELKLLEDAGNKIYNFDLIYGLPGEGFDSFREGCRWVLDRRYRLWAGPLLVLPGTAFRDRAAEFGIRYAPDPPYEVVVADAWTPQDLQRARHLSVGIDLHNRLGPELITRVAALLQRDLLDVLELLGAALDEGAEVAALYGQAEPVHWFSAWLDEALLADVGPVEAGLARELVSWWDAMNRVGAVRFGPYPVERPPRRAPRAPDEHARLSVSGRAFVRSFTFAPTLLAGDGWTDRARPPGRQSAHYLFASALGGAVRVPPAMERALELFEGGATVSQTLRRLGEPPQGPIATSLAQLLGAGVFVDRPGRAPYPQRPSPA